MEKQSDSPKKGKVSVSCYLLLYWLRNHDSNVDEHILFLGPKPSVLPITLFLNKMVLPEGQEGEGECFILLSHTYTYKGCSLPASQRGSYVFQEAISFFPRCVLFLHLVRFSSYIYYTWHL